MSFKVYVDGHVGTTGLVIHDILQQREDIDLVTISDELRKHEQARRQAIEECNLAILCLPDEAAIQAAEWATASGTKLIDASTAHRVANDWVYGLPEIGSDARTAIKNSDRVSNPGCYPTAVILLLRPLIAEMLLPVDTPIMIHALSGYSGGGRKLIERWEDPSSNLSLLPYSAPYALERIHKHVPEMMKYSGLEVEPQFLPRVGPFYNGMRVEIPLHANTLGIKQVSAAQIAELYTKWYLFENFVDVRLMENGTANEQELDPSACNATNKIRLIVYAHPSGHVLLVGILDNLAKGASGAAIQSMNLMLGFDEKLGLDGAIATGR